MFVGRKKELQMLDDELNKDSTSVLVYGKRKIGKTTLIKEACKNHNDKKLIYFECLKDTENRNIEEMIKILKCLDLISPYVSLPNNTFLSLFSYRNYITEQA